VPRGDGAFIWKISNRTVGQIPKLYDEFGYGPLEERLIEILPDITILNIELFKWVIVLGTALIAFPILFVLLSGMSRIIVRQASPRRDLVRRFLTRPFLWLVLIMITNHVSYSLGLGIEAQRFADAHTIDITIVTWVLLSATNLMRAIFSERLERQGKEAAVVLLGPIGNATKIVIVILAVLAWLSNLGFNITALLAGLGVGGIAVALALQKPLEDLFGAISMYTQQPVRVGDYCRFGEIEGTVVEIGLRTTRIRTLGNTVVSIPNAKIAGDVLDNYSVRQNIWYNPTLILRYDSTAEQLRQIVSEIEEFLIAHDKVVEDPCRVRVAGFGKAGIELEVYAYIKTSDYAEYMEIAEQLNLSVIEIITRSDTEFAVPFTPVIAR
jgi:MscS family membrane protein